MIVTVRLFGAHADRLGCSTVQLQLPGRVATCTQVLAALGDHAPALADDLATCRLAVNHAYAGPDDPVTPGDDLALIGMVSGG